jgi:hypothetical protein
MAGITGLSALDGLSHFARFMLELTGIGFALYLLIIGLVVLFNLRARYRQQTEWAGPETP